MDIRESISLLSGSIPKPLRNWRGPNFYKRVSGRLLECGPFVSKRAACTIRSAYAWTKNGDTSLSYPYITPAVKMLKRSVGARIQAAPRAPVLGRQGRVAATHAPSSQEG